MKSKILFFVAGSLITALLLGTYLIWKPQITKVHHLTTPLQLSTTEASNGLLPRGTTLYYDSSFPEGFSRYKIYVNIDRMPLELESVSNPSMIDPLDAAPFTQAALLKLLKNHPLTKDDLLTIIKTGYLSPAEIKEVLIELTNGQ